MSRGQSVFLHLANLAVSGTGLVYAWMRYLAEPVDEWAIVNHPWQPHTQHLHILTAPLLVFAVQAQAGPFPFDLGRVAPRAAVDAFNADMQDTWDRVRPEVERAVHQRVTAELTGFKKKSGKTTVEVLRVKRIRTGRSRA